MKTKESTHFYPNNSYALRQPVQSPEEGHPGQYILPLQGHVSSKVFHMSCTAATNTVEESVIQQSDLDCFAVCILSSTCWTSVCLF